MNRIVVFCMLLALLSCSVQAQKATVQGTLDGMPQASTRIEVSFVSGSSTISLDTVVLDANKTFRMDLIPTEPTMYLLKTIDLPQPTITHLMVHPRDKMTVNLAYQSRFNYMEVRDVKGSDDMMVYRSFNQILLHYAQQMVALEDEFASPATTDARKRELQNIAGQMQAEQANEIINLLRANTDKLMSAFLVTYFDQNADEFIDLYEEIANGLKPKYSDNGFVRYVDNKVRNSLGPGRLAPEIVMKNPDGQELKLSSLRGKVVLLDFWASWCRPCRMENPNVVRLYHQYHEKGFDIYSVSLDRKREDWLRAIQQDGLVWTNHVSDLNGWTSSGGAAYGVTSIPATVLIDRDGRIIARNLRGGELAAKLKELLGGE